VLVHPEIADGNLMDWAFFRIEVPAPHPKLPAGDKHHSLRRRFHDVRPPSDDISQGSLLPTSTTFCRAWHAAAAGWILGGRNIVNAFLQAPSHEPSVTAAVTARSNIRRRPQNTVYASASPRTPATTPSLASLNQAGWGQTMTMGDQLGDYRSVGSYSPTHLHGQLTPDPEFVRRANRSSGRRGRRFNSCDPTLGSLVNHKLE
jgi:hypothetical protein